MDSAYPKKILVIKLGALGDIIQAMGHMRAIRRHHAGDDITLLTTKPYVSLAQSSGYFNHVLTDDRPKWNQPRQLMGLRAKLQAGEFDRVYDLQNNDRTRFYSWLMGRPEWFGANRVHIDHGAAPPHAFVFLKHVLAHAGIEQIETDTLEWMQGDLGNFDLGDEPFVLLAPGSSPKRPEKRWPAERYGALARTLYGWGFRPVIIGTVTESEIARTICEMVPEALDLTGQTSLSDLVLLGRHAAAAIGNDTGPMHLIGPTGCPSLVLFSQFSDPARHAPLGDNVETLQVEALDRLATRRVVDHLNVRNFRHPGESIAFTHSRD